MPKFDPDPPYPDLGPKVARLRRCYPCKEYGLAVLEAIRCKQRQELQSSRPHGVTGAIRNTSKDILRAIANRQAAALLAYPGQVRRKRTEAEWRKLYDEAMKR